MAKPAFVPNTTISSADVNADLSDIASGLTGSIAADGQTTIVGQLKFPAGSAATPSHTFSTELTSGMYLSSSGVIGMSTLGVATVLFDGTKVGTGKDGNQFYYANTAVPGPVGQVIDFAGFPFPLGWILCFGQAISRTGYPELFTVIGTFYGSGDGSTTFNLPDCRGRVTVGKANMGGVQTTVLTTTYYGADPNGLGAIGGAQSSTLVQANIPSYNLSFSLTASAQSITTTTVGGIALAGGGASSIAIAPPNNTGQTTNIATASSSSVTGTVSSGGSGTAISIVQPSIIFNKMIFAGRP